MTETMMTDATISAATTTEVVPAMGGDVLLRLLGEQHVEYLFANAGTDFPSLIEALATLEPARRLPRVLTIPHENLAVSMAHGHTMVSGRPQAVMLHVNVGLANGLNGLFNAGRANIPMLLMSGRTPLTEGGMAGSRSRHIHWAQEMFDQTGLAREGTKWSFEVTSALQLETAVMRGLAIAASEPAGPVYLSLPREPLAAPAPTTPGGRRLPPTAPPSCNAHALKQVAQWLAAAERPLIIASGIGRTLAEVEALALLAEQAAIPVVTPQPRYVCLPYDHPMHLGYEARSALADADLVLVVECDVPWILELEGPPATARVVQLGFDPLFVNYPLRGFPIDLALSGDPAAALRQLAELLDGGEGCAPISAERLARRRSETAAVRSKMLTAGKARALVRGEPGGLSPAWVGQRIDALRPIDSIIVNEMGGSPADLTLDRPGSYFGGSPAGGLGWGLGAALGAKLACPERMVICLVGDGSYMFGNPTPAHWASRAHNVPVLFVILNNSGWSAVRRATVAMYPKGAAAAVERPPLTDLSPSPAFEQVVEACGGHGERVDHPDELEPALRRCMQIVAGGRQALINVTCRME
ncbi:thiamine pyrophosphate-requiring protein [Paraburkholderia caffeinilytica]|uniref:thiamine pyrophosphate-requiring protein n=1 Tax=Paraburkholderia caffeinilytica TaxID=1761016 RepID=UPI003DA0119D